MLLPLLRMWSPLQEKKRAFFKKTPQNSKKKNIREKRKEKEKRMTRKGSTNDAKHNTSTGVRMMVTNTLQENKRGRSKELRQMEN